MKLGLTLSLLCSTLIALPVSAQNETALRIGAIFPFTGKQARQGALGKVGVELALAELNDFHPQVVYEDSQSDTKEAVAAFHKLQSLNSVNVVLTMGSPAAMALLPLANNSKTLLLAMVVVSAYSAPDDYGFRLMGTAESFGKRVSELLADELGKKRIALMYVEDDYGSTYAKFFDTSLAKKSLLAAKESYLPGTNDFRPALLKLKSRNPDALILASWGVEAGTLLRQGKELGLSAKVYACPSACDNPDIAVSGAGATDPLVVVASASDTTPARTQLLRERFNEAPTSVVLRFYDAIAVLRQAAAECSERAADRSECLRLAVANARNVPGSSYPINFDQNGVIIDSFQLKVVQNGALVPGKVQNGRVVAK